ncbi:DNA-binding MarR family transcriptional regulator [Sinobacterium caligoides]|uniref:DNA-binding MarR family transcriptional regulator n=1 Tax=Sinobacterium caligoides TaxID=933926 RepID=A0A3N2DDR4_9GAMM|nr:MarR family transcriptional regulator [Sinobacterium caligoides]ROR97916.1 DNA-binding MarR family transcriptional regulator [Sinobacterium caligoides]
MPNDHVDLLLEQWREVKPDIDCSPMAVIGRLARANALIMRGLTPVFKAHQLSGIEFDILASLRRHDVAMTPTDLYKGLMLSSGAISTRLDNLVHRGYIERHACAQDRRSCTVVLTAEGTKLIDQAVAAHVDNEAQLLSSLSRSEQEKLAQLLRKWLLANE